MAFVPFNGRPIYNTIGFLLKFLNSPKILIFHKEAQSSSVKIFKDAKVGDEPVVIKQQATAQDTQDNLKKVQKLLRDTASQESDMAGKI